MTRRAVVAGAIVLAVGGSVPLWGPLSLRRVARFAVERVEISGTQMLAPHQVLAASGIAAGHNVWDDPGPWEAALRAHPAIADARVSRRIPGTLLIRVRERLPAGFVDNGVLQPVADDGTVLPLDPALAPVDLPVLRTGGLTDSAAAALVAESGRLAALDPMLWRRVSEVRRAPRRGLLLRIGDPRAEVMLAPGADHARLRQVRSTLNFVARHLPPDSGSHVRLDLRWEDQIVLARSTR